MIDFNKIEVPFKIDEKFILSKVDEVQIFYYYFGHFELGKAYPPKLRKGSGASTGFYISKDNVLIYNDFKTGQKTNCFKFVALLHGISYGDALRKIAVDFGLIKSDTANAMAKKILDKTIEFDRETKRNTIIQIEPDTWQAHHIKYWKQYEITVNELKREEVYPVKKLFVNKAEYHRIDELCFAYKVDEVVGGKVVNTYLKIYQPMRTNENGKWTSNVPITVPFGMRNLKYGSDHCMIGKAQKDRLVLLKLFQSVIGTQNESEAALPSWLVKHLKFHFQKLTIFWDSDETGVTNCTKFNEKGFGYFNIPNEFLPYNIKDASDYVKAFGLKALEKLLVEKNIL